MEIRIGEYIITSDENNVVLNTVMVNKSPKSKNYGAEYLCAEGYYPTLEMALRALCNKELRKTDAATVEELQQEIARLWELIAKCCG